MAAATGSLAWGSPGSRLKYCQLENAHLVVVNSRGAGKTTTFPNAGESSRNANWEVGSRLVLLFFSDLRKIQKRKSIPALRGSRWSSH